MQFVKAMTDYIYKWFQIDTYSPSALRTYFCEYVLITTFKEQLRAPINSKIIRPSYKL